MDEPYQCNDSETETEIVINLIYGKTGQRITELYILLLIFLVLFTLHTAGQLGNYPTGFNKILSKTARTFVQGAEWEWPRLREPSQ